MPQISYLLEFAAGGLDGVLKSLRFSHDPDVQQFLVAYDAVPKGDKPYVTWEAICLSADIDPRTFLGAAQLAIQSFSRDSVKIIAVSNHPDVVRKRIQYAKTAQGKGDRDSLDTAMGFLPTSKGATFIINPQSAGKAAEDDDDGEGESDIDAVFPDSERIQGRVLEIQQKLLGVK